jgi:hypothetical protein
VACASTGSGTNRQNRERGAPAPDYWDAEAASEELADDLPGVHESNKRAFGQSYD